MAHYDIFRDQLAIRYPGYGHALWEPSPGDHVVGVGDVGYIYEGRFHRLFNILLPADHPSHETIGVPDNHKSFKPKVSKHIIPGILPRDNFCSAGVALESDETNIKATRLSRCTIQVMSLIFSQAKRPRGGLVFVQREARRSIIPSDTSQAREYHGAKGFWPVDDRAYRPMVHLGPEHRVRDRPDGRPRSRHRD